MSGNHTNISIIIIGIISVLTLLFITPNVMAEDAFSDISGVTPLLNPKGFVFNVIVEEPLLSGSTSAEINDTIEGVYTIRKGQTGNILNGHLVRPTTFEIPASGNNTTQATTLALKVLEAEQSSTITSIYTTADGISGDMGIPYNITINQEGMRIVTPSNIRVPTGNTNFLIGLDALSNTDILIKVYVNGQLQDEIKETKLKERLGGVDLDRDVSIVYAHPVTLSEGVNEIKVEYYEDDILFDDFIESDDIVLVAADRSLLRIVRPSIDEIISESNIIELGVQIQTYEDGDITWKVLDSNGDVVFIESGWYQTNTLGALVYNRIFTPSLPDGDYTWTAEWDGRFSDASYSPIEGTFTVDFSSASITALYPDEGDSIRDDETFSYVVGLVNNVAGLVSINVDGGLLFSRNIDTSFIEEGVTSIRLTPPSSLATGSKFAVGSHTWNATFTADGIDETTETKTYNIIDGANANISVSLNDPDDGAEFETSTVDFNFTVNASTSIGTASLILDGVTKNSWTIPELGLHTITASVPNIKSGPHTWSISVAGNDSITYNSIVRDFTIQGSTLINLISPDDGESINKLPTIFKFSANSTVEGDYVLLVDGQIRDSVSVKSSDLMQNMTFTLELTDLLEAGDHTWRIGFVEATTTVFEYSELSEIRIFSLSSSNIGDGVTGTEQGSLNELATGPLSRAFGLSDKAALSMFAVIITGMVALFIGFIFKDSGHALQVIMVLTLLFTVVFSIAGYYPLWVLLVIVIIAAAIFGKSFSNIGGR